MRLQSSLVNLFILVLATSANAQQRPELGVEAARNAERNYEQYCALCHGADREGHANDHAPSLRSQSLMEAGYQARLMATSYGRPGTPMAGFSDEIGGPLSQREIFELDLWLEKEAGVTPIPMALRSIDGDVEMGAALYAETCAECHGANGEGITGTALGNAAMLSMTPDTFIRHAIVNGRQGTEMAAFGGTLSDDQIDALTAFIRSRASGWELRKPVYREPPAKEDYVINPDGEDPEFDLRDDLYVMAEDLHAAIQDERRMVLLDTRNMSLWQMAHIEGSVPLPYYYQDVDTLAKDLPRDGTWLVTYCECPRAAAEYVNRKLVALGFENTAVLYEGVYGWIGLGYPMSQGEIASSAAAGGN